MELQTVSNYLAEQTYLGMIIFEPDLIKESTVKEEMFDAIEHQAIFRNMVEISSQEKPLDIQSLMIKMFENGSMSIVNNMKGEGSTYLTELACSQFATENFRYYGDLITEAFRIREAQKYAREILTLQGAEGDSMIVYENLSKIQNVLETGVKRKNTLKDTLIKVYDRLESGGTVGTPTGFSEYDRMTLGFHKGDLTIVAARPSVGKTAFCLNVAVNQAGEKNEDGSDYKNHLHIFSLEMPEEQLVQRMVGMYGRINSHNIRTGQLTDDDWRKVTHSMSYFGNKDNIDIHDDAMMTVPEIRARVSAAIREFPDRDHIIIIDYLQLLTYHGKSNENQTIKVGEISKALKVLAKELKVNVTALSQLSRAVEQRQDKRPMMSDIRDSGSIEQDADNIVFLYRDDYYDRESENKNIIELIIGKQRQGAIGTVSLAFIKEYGLFVNLERRFDEQ